VEAALRFLRFLQVQEAASGAGIVEHTPTHPRMQ